MGIPSDPSTDEITELIPLPVMVTIYASGPQSGVRLRDGIEFLVVIQSADLQTQ